MNLKNSETETQVQIMISTHLNFQTLNWKESRGFILYDFRSIVRYDKEMLELPLKMKWWIKYILEFEFRTEV